jgi:hypothetical protein
VREGVALDVKAKRALIGGPAVHYEKQGCDDKAEYIFGVER